MPLRFIEETREEADTSSEINLITLNQLKAAMGIDVAEDNATRDLRMEQAISSASSACRKYAERAFGTAEATATHTYEYDDSGYIDIEDCMSVSAVVFVVQTFEQPIESAYWRAEPINKPPFTYIEIPRWYNRIINPAMGFARNLDVLVRERGWPYQTPLVKVTGSWGWPDVPGDVQQAVIYTAAIMAEEPSDYASESIAGYSYVSERTTTTTSVAKSAIPSRAKDLLAPYVRFLV